MKSQHFLSTVHDLAICRRSVQSTQKRRFHHYDSDCCLNNSWPSFHTDRIDRAAVSPSTPAALAPASHTSSASVRRSLASANHTSSISVCRSIAFANHTSSIRILRSSPDLGHPAWCSELVSFGVATQHSRRSPSADCSHLKWKSQMIHLTTPSGSL